MGDHPRVQWPDISSEQGMQALLGVLEHIPKFGTAEFDVVCAVNDARIIEQSIVAHVYPGLPTDGEPSILMQPDLNAAITVAFGDATAARGVIEGIIRECEDGPENFEASPLGGLDWMSLLIKFGPIIMELIKKWLESRK